MTRANFLYVVIMVFMFSLTGTARAQESRAGRFEWIEMEKIAFITKELNLSPEEAEQFFPLYNQYRTEFSKLRQEKRGGTTIQPRSQLQSRSLQPSGFHASRDVLAFDAKELELRKSYRAQFATVIGTSRASRFFEVEEEFRNYLMRELQQRRRER